MFEQLPLSVLVPIANGSLILLSLSIYGSFALPFLNLLGLYGKGNELAENDKMSSSSCVPKMIIQKLYSLQVPKSWFLHFYIFASAIASIHLYYDPHNLVLILLTIQCFRRMYDQFVAPKSTAKMNILHYSVGYIFYIAENISAANARPTSSPRIVIPAVLLFAAGWTMQWCIHMHLFSLKKYTMPRMAIFRYSACPHYLAESVMYVAVLVLDPSNSVAWVTLFWIFLGLGVASQQSKQFYEAKFPNHPNLPRYGMVPFLW